MKTKTFLPLFLLIVAGCVKNENHRVGTRSIEVQTITSEADFKHLKLDSAYVFFDYPDLMREMFEKEGQEAPDVDMSKNSVIVVTGIAPAKAEKIEASLLETEGKNLVLKIDIETSDKEQEGTPQKWNLVLKTEPIGPPVDKCEIRYDRDFVPERVPQEAYMFYTAGQKIPFPINIIDSAYMILFDSDDRSRIVSAVNEDEECIMVHTTTTAPRFAADMNKALGLDVESYDYALLRRCDYDRVFGSSGEAVKYAGRGVGGNTYSGSMTYVEVFFFLPLIKYTTDDDESIKLLADNLGYETVEGERVNTLLMKKGSRVNPLQLSGILVENEYVRFISSESYTRHQYSDFFSAQKRVYE